MASEFLGSHMGLGFGMLGSSRIQGVVPLRSRSYNSYGHLDWEKFHHDSG